MAAPFNNPANVVKGTYIQNGIRSGVGLVPPAGPSSNTSVTNSADIYPVSNYMAGGGGIYYSPTYTYRFVPYGGTIGNIVALSEVSAAGWLPLNGDGFAATLLTPNQPVPYGIIREAGNPQNTTPADTPQYVENAGVTYAGSPTFPPGAPNTSYIQFDFPRVPAIGLYNTSDDKWGNGAAMTAPTNITIFGFDVYNQPMQHTYTVGSVPGEIVGPNQFPGYMFGEGTPSQVNCKAFYGITGVYCNGTTGANTQLHVYTCNTFGLPYSLSDYGDIKDFTMNNYDLKNASMIGIILAGSAEGVIYTYLADDAYAAYQQESLSAANAPRLSPIIVEAGDTDKILSIANVYRYNDSNNAFGDKGFITVQLSAAVEAGNTYTYSLYFPNSARYLAATGYGLNEGASPNSVSSATSVDVRGLIILPDMNEDSESGELPIYDENDALIVPDGGRIVSFTYYVKGADQQINVAAAGRQPKGFLNDSIAPENTPGQVAALEFKDMYGYKQYYTGVPD